MINSINENHGRTAKARSQSYGLFSTIFMGDWDSLLSHLPKTMAVDEEDFFSFLNQLQDTDLFELKVQYDNLFVAPGFYFVSPYLSSYVADENDVRSNLSVLYKKTELPIFDDRGELPDHIANILSYMQWLLSMEEAEWQKEDGQKPLEIIKMEKEFIQKYLFWVPQLKNKVVEKLEYGFMLDAVNKLNDLVSWHLEEVNELLSDSNNEN